MEIRSKLPQVGVTIFTVMTQLANEHRAYNLSQGFPDFDPDPALIGLVEKYMRSGHNQYAPMQGVQMLREVIAEKVNQDYGARPDPDQEITVTAGATEALFAAITAIVQKGDEVIVFEPAYDSYVPAIELSGGIPVFIKLKFPDYSVDWNAVEDAVNEKTRAIIINSPHNPTGTVLTHRDIDALIRITDNNHVLLISDEVYEHILFDGLVHEGVLRYPRLAQKSFVISSFGKTYHATGWKIGYCVAPDTLTTEFRRIHQFLTFAANTPVQYAYAEFLKTDADYRELNSFYQDKRDRFQNMMNNSHFSVLPCRGTYFQLLDYSSITDEADTEFAKRLTKEHKVAAIPPSVFYHEKDDHKVLRFCFAKTDDTLEKAAERLCEI